jgi:hypothetical protein
MLGAGWGKAPFLFSPRKQVLALYWNTHRHLWEDGMMTRVSCLQARFHMEPHGLGHAQLLGIVVKQERFATLRKSVYTAIPHVYSRILQHMIDDLGILPL